MKILCLFLSLLLVFSFIVSCDKVEDTPEVATTGVTTTVATTTEAQQIEKYEKSIVYRIPYENSYYRYTDKPSDLTASILFNGEEYTLDYKDSYKPPFGDQNRIDAYKYWRNTTRINVEIDSQTKKMVYFEWDGDFDAYKQSKLAANETLLTESEYLEIVKTFVADYGIENLDDYHISKWKDPQGIYGYGVCFEIIVDGVKTVDRIEVHITEYGDVCYYSAVNAGNIDSVPTVSADDYAKIEAKMIEYIADRYKNRCFSVCPNKDGFHASFWLKRFARIGDKYAVVYDYEAYWHTNYDEGECDKLLMYMFIE